MQKKAKFHFEERAHLLSAPADPEHVRPSDHGTGVETPTNERGQKLRVADMRRACWGD